jgi:hypothetical protein
MFTRARHGPYSDLMDPLYIFHTILNIHYNISHPTTPRSSKFFLSFRFYNSKCIRILCLCHACCMAEQFHSPWFDQSNNIWWREQAMQLVSIHLSASQSSVTTDGQSASLSWNKAPIWGLRQDFYCCQTLADLLMWGALSDERTGLSFTTASGPRQRSHRIRVPWDTRPYFTASDSRLPFSSPPTTCRATMEAFDPSSTRDSIYSFLHLFLT